MICQVIIELNSDWEKKFVFLGREITRQNRITLYVIVIASLVLLLTLIFGAPIYYYKFSRNDTKASISKNPNYGWNELHILLRGK